MAFSYVALALEMLHVYLLEKGWVWLYPHMGAARLTNYLGLKVQSSTRLLPMFRSETSLSSLGDASGLYSWPFFSRNHSSRTQE